MSARYAAIGLALSQMACLVTDPIDFPEERPCPPSIGSSQSAHNRLDQVVRFNVDERGGTDDAGAPTMPELTFEVVVFDCNLDQNLVARTFVDGVPNEATGRVVHNTGALRRDFDFTVPGTFFAGAGTCHKVELLVSGAFVVDDPRRPIDPDDLATAVWWVRSTDDLNTPVDMALCN